MRSAPPDKSNLQAYANRPASLELPGSPFQRVTTLLDGIEPGLAEIDLGVGGPQHQMPAFVEPVLMQKTAEFRHYPPSKGTPEFLQSVRKWLDHRYALDGLVGEDAILPLNGSREGLFFALFEAKRRKPVEDPLVFSPNPFYQTYAAAAKAAGCRFLSPPDSAAEGMAAESLQGLPDFAALAPELLADTVAVYVASPTNPQGNSATLGYWQNLIELADRHDFMIFADECYSEIYRDSPPTGILEAARSAGSTDHVISFNSLSKRSNLPGLRVGFMAGDAKFLTELAKFRNRPPHRFRCRFRPWPQRRLLTRLMWQKIAVFIMPNSIWRRPRWRRCCRCEYLTAAFSCGLIAARSCLERRWRCTFGKRPACGLCPVPI